MVILVDAVDQSFGADMYTASVPALSDKHLFHEWYASGEFCILLFGLKTTPKTQNTILSATEIVLETCFSEPDTSKIELL